MFLYFAYGSNMLTERLVARCPSARAVGLARVEDYSLVWDKLGKDGSGKFGIVKQTGKVVHGVLFELALSDRPELDRFEDANVRDPGYRRDDGFEVMRAGGGRENVTTYLPLEGKRVAGLRPYGWYRALAQAGALQHVLDAGYIAAIAAIVAQSDPEPDRQQRLDAHGILEAAGYPHLIGKPD